MGGDGYGKDAGPPPLASQLINVDEAWAQPLGPLDLVTLEVEGAVLEPVFSPTVVQYEAYPEAAPQATSSEGTGASVALALDMVVEPARRGTPVQVASPTGVVEELGRCGFRFRGPAHRDHHVMITLGWPEGPSRTTVVAVRRVPDPAADRSADGVLRAGGPRRR